MRNVRVVIAALALLVLPLGASTAQATALHAKTTVKKVSFTATTVTGAAFNSKSLYTGKPTVIWFWAPWCAICANESADIVAAATKYKDRVNFVGVGALGSAPEMQEFVSAHGIGIFPNIADTNAKVWAKFGVVLQPSLIFIDKTGKSSIKIGPSDADFLNAKLKSLTSGKK